MKARFIGTAKQVPPLVFARAQSRTPRKPFVVYALPRIVSLFSGAGGLDLGFQQVGFFPSFAIDLSPAAIRTHRRNFKGTFSVPADLVKIGPGGVLAHLDSILEPGESIGVIGGPPCQGFSRGNSRSHTDDPRNLLPFLYLRIVEAIQQKYKVEFVVFENVLGLKDRRHADTFHTILSKLCDMGFNLDVNEYSALDYGVAQVRNRLIVSAFRDQTVAQNFKPEKVVADDLTVRDKIGMLPEPIFFSRKLDRSSIPHHENHWTMRPISKRFSEPDVANWGGRSFRRLEWDKPSPTIAYGHREIHVHPSGRRRLSIYEAMLLQGFSHSFVLEGTLSSQVEQISNAVPPPLAKAIALAIRTAI